MKSLKERIAIEQAFLDGKETEWRLDDGGIWDKIYTGQNKDGYIFNWGKFDYRIKQEPMEFWVNVYEPNAGICYGFHETKNGAVSGKSPDCIKTIKVMEVTE